MTDTSTPGHRNRSRRDARPGARTGSRAASRAERDEEPTALVRAGQLIVFVIVSTLLVIVGISVLAGAALLIYTAAK
ncbi:hypothetical protein [Streptomyces sp. ICBB 8177]|uniref:hypothetical protein n=1 Tax=Streptomyces sp. ICBB 8177 TaxID=563922 RepID=UPI000D67B854|nr:hypothetical protein [Streptomyces sp. ICBB 8177]PWI45735.1 hypothetical protein CK485_00720 [Streptomyces sp. ICBB 8177]